MLASFVKDIQTYNTWGGDHFGPIPIIEEMIDTKYIRDNEDCVEADNFFPMVAFDEGNIVGSFIIC